MRVSGRCLDIRICVPIRVWYRIETYRGGVLVCLDTYRRVCACIGAVSRYTHICLDKSLVLYRDISIRIEEYMRVSGRRLEIRACVSIRVWFVSRRIGAMSRHVPIRIEAHMRISGRCLDIRICVSISLEFIETFRAIRLDTYQYASGRRPGMS